MSVTIRQIASRAGVSRGTVDRVLNGRPGVKPKVREHVLAIAEQLQYVPNVAAKALAHNKKPVEIGIVMPPEEITFFQEIRNGIQTAVEELKGFGIRLQYYYVNNQQPEESAETIRKLIELGASGILFSVLDDEIVRESINEASDRGIPVVTFNSDVENSKRVCFVGQDLPKSGAIGAGLMRRMLGGGAKIAVVTGSMKIHAHRTRVNSFKKSLEGSGIEVLDVLECYDRYADTKAKLGIVLQEHPDLGGIYMATGHVGACLDAVKRAGMGGKLRIVCNDLVPEVEQGLREGIIDFTIMQDASQQGYRSLKILFDLIFTGKKPEKEHHYTETRILVRESL